MQDDYIYDSKQELEKLELTKEQESLIGKGLVGPAVDLDGNGLSNEQVHMIAALLIFSCT